VASFTAVPFGQNDDPGSPHAWDQAEALFSRERLKPTGYRKRGSGLPPGLRLQHILECPPHPAPPKTIKMGDNNN
jgi:hypothetical protein